MSVEDYKAVLGRLANLSDLEKIGISNELKRLINPSSVDIKHIVGELRETRFSDGIFCPHCESKDAIRHGMFKGRQRYLCKECSRTFNDFTNTPMQRTHLPDKWMKFVGCMIKGLSLRKAAEEIGGITHVTLFYWRHKILAALRKLDVEQFEGIVEADETYFLFSRKGQRRIEGRDPRKRGGVAKKRGLSGEQVGVMVARDRQEQLIIKVTGTGKIDKDAFESVLGAKLKENVTLCSDADRTYCAFTQANGIPHVVLNAKKNQRVKKVIYHIQNVNSLHKRLKEWMMRFNGVASKYLDNYMAWFKFIVTIGFKASEANKKQMIVTASNFNVEATCKSLRFSRFQVAT